MKLFCYGTLRKGKRNHGYLDGATYLGEYYTDKSYSLVVAGLPFLVKRKGFGVKGELYEIDDNMLRSIDRLEGHPGFYTRETIWVTSLEDGNQVEAYTYTHPDIFNSKEYPWDYEVKQQY